MKIVVTVATLDPEHGGPARTVPAHCRALVDQGADLKLITIAENGRKGNELPVDGFKASVVETVTDRYHPRQWSKQFQVALREAVSAKDAILYDVGLWLPSNHFAAQVATQTQTPLVNSPRGMLSDQALKVSRWKKKIAWTLYQGGDLGRARVLHATSDAEARDFRARKLSQPIAIVPNGVDVPTGIDMSRGTRHSSQTLLFLSRLHPIKGLPDLVRAWARVQPKSWRVVIAGPDEHNHKAEIEGLAESLGVRRDFEFIGPVDDGGKWKLLADSELFVLPSYSESFGMAIAEALAAGVPVITTKATPWRDIETHRCGWWVDTGTGAIAAALEAATGCGAEELRRMGERGRKLVEIKYSWDSAAKNLLSVFEWALHRAGKPTCIV